jgi:hypothetical protein
MVQKNFVHFFSFETFKFFFEIRIWLNFTDFAEFSAVAGGVAAPVDESAPTEKRAQHSGENVLRGPHEWKHILYINRKLVFSDSVAEKQHTRFVKSTSQYFSD